MEAEKRLNDKTIYKDVTFNKNIIQNLTEKSNGIFQSLNRRGFISERQFKYFQFDFKNSCNLGKLYFLPKIYKRLLKVPGSSVTSNCGIPTEKVSELSDNQLQAIMRKGCLILRIRVILLIKFGERVLYLIMLFWLQLLLLRYTLASITMLD